MLKHTPLRRQRDYRLLWASRTISITGSEVSKLAIPLTGVTLLAASPSQMGMLTAAAFAPALLFGLQAGAIADRMRRHRPLMIACELVSAAAALVVPLAWMLGLLSVPLLIGVALVIGSAGVLFKAANFPHLAAIVPANQRTEAMAGLQASYSTATVAGPGLGGLLVQLLTAPLAVLVEGASFLISALLMGRIRTPEANTPAPSRGMLRDVLDGLRPCLSVPTLRALLGAGATINFFAMAYIAVHMLYMVNTLAIPQGMIGGLVALSGVGGLIGAWLTARLSKKTGTNRLLQWSVLLFPLDILTVGLIGGPLWWKVTAMSASALVTGVLVVTFATCMGAVTLRETPPELRGRVNATFTFAVQGVLALGGLAGGALAEVVGLRPVIFVCAAGISLSALWIWTSPLRTPHDQHDITSGTDVDEHNRTPGRGTPHTGKHNPTPRADAHHTGEHDRAPGTDAHHTREHDRTPATDVHHTRAPGMGVHHTGERGTTPGASAHEVSDAAPFPQRRDFSWRQPTRSSHSARTEPSPPTYGNRLVPATIYELTLVKMRSLL